METLGKITMIEEVHDIGIKGWAEMEGKNGSSLGLIQMLDGLAWGVRSMDGYKVTTDKHTFHVLIDNGQSCCERWGYLSSEDNFSWFIGRDLIEVKLTDVALNHSRVDNSGYYVGCDGGIQFVDFVTSQGILQLAVYNAHNGYYGHGILVAKDEETLLSDTL